MLMDESIEKENKNKIRTENDSHCLIIGSFFNPQEYRVIVKIVACVGLCNHVIRRAELIDSGVRSFYRKYQISQGYNSN